MDVRRSGRKRIPSKWLQDMAVTSPKVKVRGEKSERTSKQENTAESSKSTHLRVFAAGKISARKNNNRASSLKAVPSVSSSDGKITACSEATAAVAGEVVAGVEKSHDCDNTTEPSSGCVPAVTTTHTESPRRTAIVRVINMDTQETTEISEVDTEKQVEDEPEENVIAGSSVAVGRFSQSPTTCSPAEPAVARTSLVASDKDKHDKEQHSDHLALQTAPGQAAPKSNIKFVVLNIKKSASPSVNTGNVVMNLDNSTTLAKVSSDVKMGARVLLSTTKTPQVVSVPKSPMKTSAAVSSSGRTVVVLQSDNSESLQTSGLIKASAEQSHSSVIDTSSESLTTVHGIPMVTGTGEVKHPVEESRQEAVSDVQNPKPRTILLAPSTDHKQKLLLDASTLGEQIPVAATTCATQLKDSQPQSHAKAVQVQSQALIKSEITTSNPAPSTTTNVGESSITGTTVLRVTASAEPSGVHSLPDLNSANTGSATDTKPPQSQDALLKAKPVVVLSQFSKGLKEPYTGLSAKTTDTVGKINSDLQAATTTPYKASNASTQDEIGSATANLLSMLEGNPAAAAAAMDSYPNIPAGEDLVDMEGLDSEAVRCDSDSTKDPIQFEMQAVKSELSIKVEDGDHDITDESVSQEEVDEVSLSTDAVEDHSITLGSGEAQDMKPVKVPQTHEGYIMSGHLIKCTQCKYVTDKRSNWYKHKKIHQVRDHKCPKCPYQASTSSNLRRHMMIHENIRQYQCSVCNMKFRQKIHLERHVNHKHTSKLFHCTLCDFVCSREVPELRNHWLRKHVGSLILPGKETLECKVCGYVTLTKKDFQQHQKYHKKGSELKLFCKFCSFVTDCHSRLKRHLLVHSREKPFACGMCSYVASQKEHVVRHMRVKHGVITPSRVRRKALNSQTEKNGTSTDNTDESPLLNSTPPPRKKLQTVSYDNQEKVFACNFCSMKFLKLINLYKHVHIQHKDQLPPQEGERYNCVVCEFSTPFKRNLLVHMRKMHNSVEGMNTPQKQLYICVLCNYSNPYRLYLHAHMKKEHNMQLVSDKEGVNKYVLDSSKDSSVLLQMAAEEEQAQRPGSIIRPRSGTASTTSTASDSLQAKYELHSPDNLPSSLSPGMKTVLLQLQPGGPMTPISVSLGGDPSETHSDLTLEADPHYGMDEAEGLSLNPHSALVEDEVEPVPLDTVDGLQVLADQANASHIIQEMVEFVPPESDESHIVEVASSYSDTLGDAGLTQEQVVSIEQPQTEVVTGAEGSEVAGVEGSEVAEVVQLVTGDYVEINGQMYKVEMDAKANGNVTNLSQGAADNCMLSPGSSSPTSDNRHVGVVEQQDIPTDAVTKDNMETPQTSPPITSETVNMEAPRSVMGSKSPAIPDQVSKPVLLFGDTTNAEKKGALALSSQSREVVACTQPAHEEIRPMVSILGNHNLTVKQGDQVHVVTRYPKPKLLTSFAKSVKKKYLRSMKRLVAGETISEQLEAEGRVHETEDYVQIGRQIKCKKCDYVANRRSQWYRHSKKHKDTRGKHLCWKCSYQTHYPAHLARHMLMHDNIFKYQCQTCKREFRQKVHLTNHMRRKHSTNRVRCPLCPFTCASEVPDLKDHWLISHGGQPCDKTVACSICGYITISKKDIQHHIKAHNSSMYRFSCEHCPYVTVCQSSLQRHSVIHTQEKPFPCELCSYAATQKVHMVRHMRTQHGVEPSCHVRNKNSRRNLAQPNAQVSSADTTSGSSTSVERVDCMAVQQTVELSESGEYYLLLAPASDSVNVDSQGQSLALPAGILSP